MKSRFRGVVALLLALMDRLWSKRAGSWCFQLGADHQVNGNLGAFLDYAAGQGINCHVLALTPGKVDRTQLPQRANLLALYSKAGVLAALRSSVYLVHHRRVDRWLLGIGPGPRLLVNLWHGIPIKAVRSTIEAGEQKRQRRDFLPWLSRRLKAEERYSSVICSSRIDRLAMAACFDLPYRQVWLTGLPRTDALFDRAAQHTSLPAAVLSTRGKIETLKDGRSLVLYAPTFREPGDKAGARFATGLFPLAPDQRKRLDAVLEKHNALLGVRLHPYFSPDELGAWAEGGRIVNLGGAGFADTQGVLMASDLLITDYSSIWLDFMITGRSSVCWAHDVEAYQRQRGWIYSLEQVFPGPILEDSESLLGWLDSALSGEQEVSFRHQHAMRFFYEFQDGKSSERLFKRLTSSLKA